jgi:hypothetical protein
MGFKDPPASVPSAVVRQALGPSARSGGLYISDQGDDKNDGRTRATAIYSWKRAIKLCDGNGESHLMQGDATLRRLAQEIERRKRK